MPTLDTEKTLRGDTTYAKELFWFRRKHAPKTAALDEQYIPIQGEAEARLIVDRRDFRDKFDFIGRSSGRAYAAALVSSKVRKLSNKEKKQLEEMGELEDEARAGSIADASRAAFAAELEDAKKKKDKRWPRKMDVRNIDGQPVTTGAVVDTVRMMGRS